MYKLTLVMILKIRRFNRFASAFGKEPITSTYLIEQADFIACHNASYLHKYDLLKGLKDGGTFLLNTIWDQEKVHRLLPAKLKNILGSTKSNFTLSMRLS